ncbi:hypothetical protein [Chryseobacterium sp. ERMR1:04]|uniref:hypothetical protein n=1 Tax=Chryseobacterium sp. ERMR1:04 TaxID=1705393 RepID=UPI0013649EE0|nr:hypothetical protein [Chryseobacterium sp. ERMR1:04]
MSEIGERPKEKYFVLGDGSSHKLKRMEGCKIIYFLQGDMVRRDFEYEKIN